MAAPRKALRAFIADTQRTGSRLLLVAAVEEDLRAMERMSGNKAGRFAGWDEMKEGRCREGALLADFDAGFVEAGRKPLVVVIPSDVLGSRAHHPQPMARAWTPAFDHPDVPEPGTIVVHLQRGLAVLEGLQTFEMGKRAVREMVRLEFAGDDAALVPPADLALIRPYAGELGKLDARQGGRKHVVGETRRGRAGNPERGQGSCQTYRPAAPPARSQAGRSGARLREIGNAFPVFHDARPG